MKQPKSTIVIAAPSEPLPWFIENLQSQRLPFFGAALSVIDGPDDAPEHWIAVRATAEHGQPGVTIWLPSHRFATALENLLGISCPSFFTK